MLNELHITLLLLLPPNFRVMAGRVVGGDRDLPLLLSHSYLLALTILLKVSETACDVEAKCLGRFRMGFPFSDGRKQDHGRILVP